MEGTSLTTIVIGIAIAAVVLGGLYALAKGGCCAKTACCTPGDKKA